MNNFQENVANQIPSFPCSLDIQMQTKPPGISELKNEDDNG